MDRKLLIIRDFMGRYLVRKVWDATKEKVYVTSESGPSEGLQPIGFPREDAFEFDEQAAKAIEAGMSWDWERLQPWRGLNETHAKPESK